MKFIMDTFSPSGENATEQKTTLKEYSRRVSAVFEGEIDQYRTQVNRFPTSQRGPSIAPRRIAPRPAAS